MDTSETYIKQCEKAEEIQKLFTTINPDYPHIKVTQHDYIYCPKHKSFWTFRHSGYLCRDRESCAVTGIWLPTQDQLQAMLPNYRDLHPSYLIGSFETFCSFENKPDYVKQFTSMEQLWLAFVMKEKYGKIWDSDKIIWIYT